MLFSTSLKFFGAALLLPAVLAAPSRHSTKTRTFTLVGKTGGASTPEGNSADVEIVFPTVRARQQSVNSDTYAVLDGGWKTTEGDEKVPAVATVMSDATYEMSLQDRIPSLLAYGKAEEDDGSYSYWYIYPNQKE